VWLCSYADTGSDLVLFETAGILKDSYATMAMIVDQESVAFADIPQPLVESDKKKMERMEE
jgi:hypothetical protein